MNTAAWRGTAEETALSIHLRFGPWEFRMEEVASGVPVRKPESLSFLKNSSSQVLPGLACSGYLLSQVWRGPGSQYRCPFRTMSSCA